MTVDMHCHLDLYPDPFKVTAECKKRGLYVLSVTTTPRAWEGTNRLSAGCARIKTALGFHPQLAHQRRHELELFDTLLPKARYVGEIGLDGGKGFKDHWDSQISVFRYILKSVCKAGGRIMTIHSRLCANVVLDELVDMPGIPILHWFSGTKMELRRAIDMGCWFSVGPAMLNTKKGLEITSNIPKKRVLTESDGPFAKFKGESLMPWDVELCVKMLSTSWRGSESEARQQVSDNFKDLLSMA